MSAICIEFAVGAFFTVGKINRYEGKAVGALIASKASGNDSGPLDRSVQTSVPLLFEFCSVVIGSFVPYSSPPAK